MRAEPCCPNCGGIRGYEYLMTETHLMNGLWGSSAESGDSGIDVKQSLIECIECGHKFQFAALQRKGLMG
jgi:hypothetical protein